MGIYLVFKNELIRSLQNKKKLIITLLIPIIAVIFSMGVNSILKPGISIGVINKADNEFGNKFVRKAEEVKGIKIKVPDSNALNSDMILGKYSVAIEFNEKDKFIVKSIDSNLKEVVSKIVDGYAISGEINGIEEIFNKMEKESLSIAQRGVGFIILTLMITSTILACNLLKDKEEGTLIRFNVSPRNRVEYILGVYLFNILFTFAQIAIAIIVLSIAPINIGITIPKFIIVGIAIAFISSSFAIFVACICDTELKASLVSSGIAMIVALFGGAFIPLAKMPDAVKKLSDGSVIKWLIEFTKTIENGLIQGKDYLPIFIILIMAFILVMLSVMFGKRKFD